MADEDKIKKVDAKVEDAKADAPKPSDAKVSEPTKPEPVKAEPAKPDAVKPLSVDDAHLIATIAAQVAAQMNAVQGKPGVRDHNADKTVPGGKYIIDGHTVNAWGKPYEEGRDPSHDDPEKVGH